MDFINAANLHMYIAIAISIVNAFLMWYVGYKFFQILQLSNYRAKAYMSWVKDTKGKYISRIFMLSILSFALMMVTNVILDATNVAAYWFYFGLIFYFYLVIVFVVNAYNAPKKTPLKITSRMSRLKFLFIIVCAVISFCLIWFFTQFCAPVGYAAVAITPLLLPIMVLIVNACWLPFEKWNAKRYIKQAKKKLNRYPDLIKIGITGSYGKTSTKFILSAILSEKYSVCATPLSYNTPMGITKAIIQYLDFSHQVLIAEMGARFQGDIKELCELVQPKYGILTGIGEQHLQSFGSLEKIAQTKYELVECLPQDGTIVFCGENQTCVGLYNKTTLKNKFICGFDKNYSIFADDVVTNKNGTSFNLHIGGQVASCSTRLLGKHNIENILCASSLAYDLGLTIDEIKNGIMKLQPIEHRLQLINLPNDSTILDDSYNGSIDGAQKALEVLKYFEGEKIVVTPGLVELGSKEKQANVDFGEGIAEVADKVVLVNLSNAENLKTGLKNKNFDDSNIYQVDTLENAKTLLNKIATEKSIILFYNDLPDNYL